MTSIRTDNSEADTNAADEAAAIAEDTSEVTANGDVIPANGDVTRNDVSKADAKYIEMTQSPLGKLITKMAVPSIVGNVISVVYNLTDTFYVGLLGTAASAAVGVVMPIMTAIAAFGLLFGIGAGNKMSIELGKKNIKRAQRLISFAMTAAFTAALVLALLGIAFRSNLVWILGSTASIAPLAKAYMMPLLCVAPFYTLTFVLNPALRFQGLPMDSMIGVVAGAVLNIGLEPLFIFTFHMGIFGAGLATSICQVFSFTLLLLLYRAKSEVPIDLRMVKPTRSLLREIFNGGFPSLIRNLMLAFSTDMLNVAANPFGDAAIAAMTIVGRIATLTNTVQIGIGQGYQPVCGYNYGAHKFRRVKKGYWLAVFASGIFLITMCVVQIVFAPDLVRIFQSDRQVVEYGTQAMRWMSLTFWLSSYIIMSNMMQQTIGHVVIATIVGLGRQGLFLVPALWILPPHLGFLGVMIARPIADICTLLMTIPMQTYCLRELNDGEKIHVHRHWWARKQRSQA